jgi:hypothetical protein
MMVMAWGQFIDHDITATPVVEGLYTVCIRFMYNNLPYVPGSSATVMLRSI